MQDSLNQTKKRRRGTFVEIKPIRIVVLGKLNRLFKDFVKSVSIKNNLPESIANEAGGKVFSFGSYRLGVHGKGTVIETHQSRIGY